MNSGLVATRYALALYKYVEEKGAGELVSAQVRELLAGKDCGPICDEVQQFTRLLMKNGRMDLLRLIFVDFLQLYYKNHGMKYVHLYSAIPADKFSGQLVSMLEKQSGKKVVLEETVDPSLLGGFILEVDGKWLDASVSGQMSKLRRELEKKNKRLV